MPKSTESYPLKFHASDPKAIKAVIKKLVPSDFRLKFDAERSRQFTLGPMEFALLVNTDLFRTSDFSHLPAERQILGVVAFPTAAGTYTVNRIVVLEPRAEGSMALLVMSPKGQLQFTGECSVSRGRLTGKINVSLPGIPVQVQIEGDLAPSGEIRIAKPGARFAIRSRQPEAAREQTE